VATVDDPNSVDAWVEAAGRLQPKPETKGGGGLTGSTLEDTTLVRVDWVAAKGPWRAPPSKKAFDRHREALDACHEGGWPSAKTERAVLDIAADGVPSRCHAELTRGKTGPRGDCLCRAFGSARFPAGGEGRRLELGLMNTPSSGVKLTSRTVFTRFERLRPIGGFLMQPGLDRVRLPLANCFARNNELSRTETRIRIEIDERGNVTRAGVKGKTEISEAVRACIDETLQSAAFTCTWDGNDAALDGTLHSYSLGED